MTVETYTGSRHCGAIRFEADLDLTYTFCRTCGVRAYAQGHLESLGGTFQAISVPTLELTDGQRAAIPVRYVNGRDRRYEEAPARPEAL